MHCTDAALSWISVILNSNFCSSAFEGRFCSGSTFVDFDSDPCSSAPQAAASDRRRVDAVAVLSIFSVFFIIRYDLSARVTDSTEGTQTYKSMGSLIQDDLFFSISDFVGIFFEIYLDFLFEYFFPVLGQR